MDTFFCPTLFCYITSLSVQLLPKNKSVLQRLISSAASSRVGIKPGFYHKAQPAGFYGFYEGGFWGFYGFYVGFINLKVYH